MFTNILTECQRRKLDTNKSWIEILGIVNYGDDDCTETSLNQFN